MKAEREQMVRERKKGRGIPSEEFLSSGEERKKDVETKSYRPFVAFLQLDRFTCMNFILKEKTSKTSETTGIQN